MMTGDELECYGRIVQAIAVTLDGFTDPRDIPPKNELKLPPPFFYTYSQSTFEYPAEVLWSLKIFKSLEKENRYGAFFVFDCDLNNVPTVAIQNSKTGPSLHKVVWTYFYLRSAYSRLNLDRSVLFLRQDEPILSIREDERKLFQSLERLGYVMVVPLGYASTPKLEQLLAKIESDLG
jgi:hypothetical protein